MKVYGCPDDVPWVDPDFRNYDPAAETAREIAHLDALKAWARSAGYTGKHTGEEFRTPRADGYARYMLCDGPRSCLIQLPYGDAWHDPNVEFLPKREILKRIDQTKGVAALFSAPGTP